MQRTREGVFSTNDRNDGMTGASEVLGDFVIAMRPSICVCIVQTIERLLFIE